MNKIDTALWNEFKIMDIFETNKKGNKIQVPTGASVSSKDLIEDGTTPRITVTGINNGISGMFDYNGNESSHYRLFNNFISVSFLGTVFYQEGNATLDMKVHCLKPLHILLNKYTGQYLVGAIKASLRESSYADQISSTILPEMKIKLPVDSDGNPDWNYMEAYMKDIEAIVSDKILKLESINNIEKNKIDISNWKEFSLKSLGFSNFHGKRIKKSDRIDGDIIFITAGKENCGVIGRIGNDIGIWHNPITVDMFGNCFYHDYDCFGDDNVYAFINDNLSALSKSFIASSINARNKNIFMYSDQFRQDNADTLSVLLPEKNGNPDWEYIETYMSQIEDRVKTKLNLLIY